MSKNHKTLIVAGAAVAAFVAMPLMGSGDFSAVLAALIVLPIAFVVYFLPSLVAYRRQHHQAMVVFVINIFLGWTLLGWVIALAIAASAVKAAPEST